MPDHAQDLQRFLLGVVISILGLPEEVIAVRWSISRGHWLFEIGVPANVRGLVLGPHGRHAEALEVLTIARALRIGVTERILVHVSRDG